MKLKIGDKELNIFFGYEVTLKERIISELARLDEGQNSSEAEQLEDLLLFLPEFLLVGLQVKHEEYRYDWNTKEGKEEQLSKMFVLMEEYCQGEDADVIKLFQDLQRAMLENGFLKRVFQRQKEQKEVQAKLEKTGN